jgi:hypothetical protein
MIFRIKGKEYNIPQTNKEITISQYLRLQGIDNIQEQIRILADLPDGIELDELSLLSLSLTVEYFKTGIELPDTDLNPLDLQQEPFGTIHYCYQALNTLNKHDAIILMLCYIYSGEDWSNNKRPKLHEQHYDKYAQYPAWQYLPLVVDYIDQLNKMRELWNKTLKSGYTNEEKQAGADNLERFGMYATLINMAGKDLEKYDRLHNRKWFEILLYLSYQKAENAFQKKYSEIISKKK